MCTKILSKSSSMGFQKKWSGLPIILFLLFLLENSLTLTDSEDNIHDFLGLNDPFFNPNIDSMFRAQEGGVAYLSCEVTTFITTVNIARSPPHTPNQPYPNSYSFLRCSIWITSQYLGFAAGIITSWQWTTRPSYQADHKILFRWNQQMTNSLSRPKVLLDA